ncbi:S-adenosyl-L-methionine-dependent methyltransferase [Lanmaoa asiatica]|nr:S-adenosyl-L-methionine-dependent methyltransferase [Lanmaoa asiatica]
MVRAIEFYSGIGGLHLALRRSCIPGATVIAAYDWDQTACQVYPANLGTDIVHKTDIATLTAADLSRLNADLWLLSPSCQPYTILNPLAKGAADPRAQSFLHLIDNVLPELSAHDIHPRYLLMENVAGFQDSTTRHHLVSILQRLGYVTAEFALNPLQFGIPNSRLRYYLLAKLSPLKFFGLDSTKSDRVLDHIPPHHEPHNKFQQTSRTALPNLRQFIDSTMDKEMFTQFRIPDPLELAVSLEARYTRLVERAGSILQMNENLDTTQVFDLFLAARASGDENAVRILDPLCLRYFTPTELLRIFHFTDTNSSSADFIWPPGVSTKSKYRLIGNSVNVEVSRNHATIKTVLSVHQVVRRLMIYLFARAE